MTLAARAAFSALLLLIAVSSPVLASAVESGSQTTKQLAWASIGDSYSSGEGIPGTSTRLDWNGNNCQRADGIDTNATAWGPRAKQLVASQLNVASFAHTACTGAIADAADDQLNEARSVSKLAAARPYDIITFSFGGNNIGFADVIKGCLDVNGWGVFDLTPGCDITEQRLRDRIDMLVGKRPIGAGYSGSTTLPALYDYAATRVRPGGDVIVLGYPQVVEEVGRWDRWRRNVIGNCEGIQAYDVGMLRSAAGYLNQQIALAVQAADARHAPSGVHFTFDDISTKVYETGDSPGERHALCSNTPWLNGQTTSISSGDVRTTRSFHPTQQGHDATASDLAQVLRYDVHFDDAPRGAEAMARLSSAQVPSLCEHPAGRLVNGKLPGIPEIDGFVAIDLTMRPPVDADFDGDGANETIAVADCSRGGVGWPTSLLLYGRGTTYLDEFSLEKIADRIPEYSGNRGGMDYPLEVRDGQVRTYWRGQRPSDTGAGSSLPIEVVLDVRDGHFVVVDLVVRNEKEVVDAVTAAANRHDRAALEAIPGGAEYAQRLLDAVDSGGPFLRYQCYGELDQIDSTGGRYLYELDLTGSRRCYFDQSDGGVIYDTAYVDVVNEHSASGRATWRITDAFAPP